jgi:hypothetical protein
MIWRSKGGNFMIKTEISKLTKISGKGKLLEVTEEGLLLEDVKEQVEELLSFVELKDLVGKVVSFSFSTKEDEEGLVEE